MTRIGRVTLKFADAKDYAPTVLQHVREDGERKLARFEFERSVFDLSNGLRPGMVLNITHFRYRRAA